MNPCSTNWTNGCLENPRVYAGDMKAMAAIRQKPAHITHLEALQANSTIHSAPSSLLCFLILKARKVLHLITFADSVPHNPIITLFFIPSPKRLPYDAYMDQNQNSDTQKQQNQRNEKRRHHNSQRNEKQQEPRYFSLQSVCFSRPSTSDCGDGKLFGSLSDAEAVKEKETPKADALRRYDMHP